MTYNNHIVIAGGSGFLGQNLAHHLVSLGETVVIVSRQGKKQATPWTYIDWDGHSLGEWSSVIDGAKALINLAGRTVDCVKTPDHCDEILRSRVESTLALGKAVRAVKNPPRVWVQMSTAHIYGDPPERICDEDSAFGYGLAPFVGRKWEEAFKSSLLPQIRPVILRTSFVLGRNGGALPRLAGLVRLGLGGSSGSGRQGISWIHETDMNNLFTRAILDENMSGAYLATSPNPVSNAEFMRCLRQVLGVPIGLPAFSWMVHIGAPLFLRTDPELALYGRYCVSRRLRDENFQFLFPELRSAFYNLYRAAPR
ncbi:MAG: DUF1731 domain-containing protein [Blastocatellia bacterium]|nr:DUF1731 domain-containing protein [Blastocatellia bacterium]